MTQCSNATMRWNPQESASEETAICHLYQLYKNTKWHYGIMALYSQSRAQDHGGRFLEPMNLHDFPMASFVRTYTADDAVRLQLLKMLGYSAAVDAETFGHLG